ncbi:MAG TPA: helix-turn-helix transcriptional regulator [Candidatus Polarisedimenticolia bacterium]|nr:helix-turn-helix transcriptional regulator [Candidatus Polarisedimenticolia bacterium]
MKKKEIREAYYMISVVSRRFDVHPQTLRLYEREGLLKPSRTDGNTRLYSDEDLERLARILRLTRELGVNLAGVEVILKMQEAMDSMEKDFNRLLASLRDELAKRREEASQRSPHALMKSPPSRVVPLKKG